MLFYLFVCWLRRIWLPGHENLFFVLKDSIFVLVAVVEAEHELRSV